MTKKFFITGTDTNVGKTFISSILLRKASQMGYRTAGYKPVSSGCKKKYNFLNKDALILKKYSSVQLSYEEINPIAFIKSAPPNILSQLYKQQIKKKDLSLGLENILKKSNWVIIEGAGGWYTPLSYQDTFSDWVKDEKLTVIIIVSIKIGCINHAILTEKAVLSEKIKCAGWVANNILPEDEYNLYYIQTLLNYIKSPLLGIIPFLDKKNGIDCTKITINLPE